MQFYHYRQQNSGGKYVIDDKLRINVIIEADSFVKANVRARALGMYFDGVKEGIDCPHCGDRWVPQYYDFAGRHSPQVYKLPILLVPDHLRKDADTVVHYLPEGRVFYAFAADIFRGGVPVPKEIGEYFSKRNVTVGSEIVGGGWRTRRIEENLPPDYPWVLADLPEGLSRIFDRVNPAR